MEEYVRIQEEHYVDQVAKLVLEKLGMHIEYEHHKAQLDLEKNELSKKYNALEVKKNA